MIAAVLSSIAMAPTGSRAPYCRASSPRLARAPSTRLELREGLNEAAVWQVCTLCTLRALRALRTICTRCTCVTCLRSGHAILWSCTCYACAMRTTMHLIARVPWWQWDVDELDSLVREIEAGDATLPARRLLAIALARKGDVPGAEAQARLYLLWMALLTMDGSTYGAWRCGPQARFIYITGEVRARERGCRPEHALPQGE